jgi:hypothetical protein
VSSSRQNHSTDFLCRRWDQGDSELAFVTRSLAGAASRLSRVTICTPSRAGSRRPDGAFDVFGIGIGPNGSWPTASPAAWPPLAPGEYTVVVDEFDDTARPLLDDRYSDARIFSISSALGNGQVSSPTPLYFLGGMTGSDSQSLAMHVPVNQLARAHRHNGLGFTGYLLVLTDRAGVNEVAPPTSTVAWLTARFPGVDVVVVENATAAVWRGRALRGVVSIDTRIDLWRLLAHAHAVIDLLPGRVIARECVEALRFSTPIIAPEGTTAAAHATAGGGLSFSGLQGLFDCVEQLSDPSQRATLSSVGKTYADTHYGDADSFVESVWRIMYDRKP